ncbi:exonuclease domain-containing protein [Marinilabilia sp.]|uniref:exonuclease domain-containing protein n=1 Tax=Marinilabilia sp. TaxID=2021252 RepID=UPI0025BCCF1E|nr:exonuclease domain-containing protein [Marinilabilia sp.]
MDLPKYAVIDIETTGGKAGIGRITEIAVFVMQGKKIVEEFASLINPECYIPPYISRLTGITNQMVEQAPRFYEVAKKIVEITEDTIFVAHNAPFDYNFVKKEFESLGFNYQREVLCTVRLSRKLLPGHRSYSLGNLCQDLGIPLSGRHRAGGDAHATALLLNHLIDQQGSYIIAENDLDLKGIHPDLNMEKIRTLPELTGIYYFHNAQNEVIYIGKSTNIRKRVFSHLAAKGKRNLSLKEQVVDISFEITGSELVALLRESDEIKQQKPKFNRAGRRIIFNWGIYAITDRKGYQRFFIDSIKGNINQPLDAFSTRDAANTALSGMVDKFGLCRQLCGLESNLGLCFNYSVQRCKGACAGLEVPASYNLRASKIIENLNFSLQNFVIFDDGREPDEKSFIWIERNAFKGYGWIQHENSISHPDALTDFLTGGSDNRDNRQIIRSWLRNKATRSTKILKY